MNTAEYWKYERHKGKWRKKPAIAAIEKESGEGSGFNKIYQRLHDLNQSKGERASEHDLFHD